MPAADAEPDPVAATGRRRTPISSSGTTYDRQSLNIVYAFAGARCDAVVAHVLAELPRQGRIRTGGSG